MIGPSSPRRSDRARVVVVGGGIAGLATAFEILDRCASSSLDIDLTLFESGERPGGNIRTERSNGFLCEWGPNGFLDNAPATLDLVRRLGLTGSLLPSSDVARRRYLYRGGRLHSLPGNPITLLGSPVLSLRGRVRVLLEPFGARPVAGDESVFSFACRRIGEEAASVLVDAMVSGVFAGDARALSLQSAFPQMYDMEREHGTLTRALFRKMREARRSGRKAGSPAGFSGRLTSFRLGLEELIGALCRSLGERVRLGEKVRSVVKAGRKYKVVSEGGGEEADAVVVASPAWETARIMARLDREISDALQSVPSAPVAVVGTGFGADDVGRPLDGFGFLVPRGTGPRILGSLWTSNIFPGRAPGGSVLLRTMIGGAHDLAALDLTDDALVDVVLSELGPILRVRDAPRWVRVFRFSRGIPQYNLGHAGRLARIEERLRSLPGLLLSGNSYRGISINSCVEEAGRTAEKVVAYLR